MVRNLLVGVASLTAAASASASTTIAYWNMNGLGGDVAVGDFPMTADSGSQAGAATFTLGGAFTTSDTVNYSYLDSFTGSTVNAQPGIAAGKDLALQNGPNGAANGAFIEFSIDASQLSAIELSFAARRSSTGFNSVSIDAYSGSTLLGSIASNQSWTSGYSLFSFDTTLLDGVSDAVIRMTFDGGSLTSSSGNNRLDNILIEATIIPLPGAAGLAALGLALGATRRRR